MDDLPERDTPLAPLILADLLAAGVCSVTTRQAGLHATLAAEQVRRDLEHLQILRAFHRGEPDDQDE